MDGYPHTPALVLNRTLDILATNALADALYSPFHPADNLARMTFADPAGRTFCQDWDRAAQATVANLRQAAGYQRDDPRPHGLVDTLTENSADFARLWGSHTVRGKTQEAKRFLHPDVGPLTLSYQAFDVREAPRAGNSSSATRSPPAAVRKPCICSAPSTRPAPGPPRAARTVPEHEAGHPPQG